jgi:F-type H+/Na+-transporting ATPase subunit alpha
MAIEANSLGRIGRVESVKNEICTVRGLTSVALNNIVEFSSGGQGIVLGFDHDLAQVIVLQDYMLLKRGDLVKIIDDNVTTSVGESLLGRVIDPLGNPLDELGDIVAEEKRLIEAPAKPIYQRALVKTPFHTGYLVMDSQIPIGMGQRELLLGEKKVGHDDVAVDIIINQTKNNTGVLSIYVAIDAESTAAKRRIERLRETGALKNTVVIIGRTAESASLNYIAPMVGMTIAEWFAAKNRNVLIVFDNLTRHAKVYRQLSLLLNRPASREAFPGDIFYLHSRLLERCGAFNEQAGGGTITALPVVETQSEEATDYITTNLMSITDGHVLFKLNLANKGIQPPIDEGFSVSRIGGRAQDPVMRQISSDLKKIIIRYEEVARFMAFGSDLHGDALHAIELGKWTEAVFYQSHDECYSPPLEVLLSHFIVSKKALRWPAQQTEEVKTALLAFVTQPAYAKLLNDAYYAASLEQARPVLDELLATFENDPKTPRPAKKQATLIAETETITGLLRAGETGGAGNA